MVKNGALPSEMHEYLTLEIVRYSLSGACEGSPGGVVCGAFHSLRRPTLDRRQFQANLQVGTGVKGVDCRQRMDQNIIFVPTQPAGLLFRAFKLKFGQTKQSLAQAN